MGLAALLTVVTGSVATAPPRPVLWAWERATDLSFADPRRVEVAFLSQTLSVRDGRLIVTPRQQPLAVAPGTAVIPVTRVEPSGLDAGRPLPALAEEMAAAVAATAARWSPRAVQLDFEARRSQRAFHRALVVETRRRLPAGVGLSITALASWCVGDPWLDGLPVTEVVPMLFRMGPETDAVFAHLEARGDFSERACRGSVGVAVEEGLRWMPRGRRPWVFSAAGWSPALVARVLARCETSRSSPPGVLERLALPGASR